MVVPDSVFCIIENTNYLLNILALNNGPKAIRDFVQYDPLQFVSAGAGDVPGANGILHNNGVPTPLRSLTSRGGNTDVSL